MDTWNRKLTDAEKFDIRHGKECPDCGERAKEQIEDNGRRALHDRTYLCLSCTIQWDAADPRWS